jgi:hypothetical protein
MNGYSRHNPPTGLTLETVKAAVSLNLDIVDRQATILGEFPGI